MNLRNPLTIVLLDICLILIPILLPTFIVNLVAIVLMVAFILIISGYILNLVPRTRIIPKEYSLFISILFAVSWLFTGHFLVAGLFVAVQIAANVTKPKS